MKPLSAAEKRLPESQAGGGAPVLFRQSDMRQGLELVGDGFRFDKRVRDDEPLLEGRMFYMRQLQPGLVLHCAQVRDLRDLQTQVLQQPGLKLSLLVGGASQFAFGRRRYHLGPQAQPGRRNCGALVALSEQDTFWRQWRRGRQERKISITLKPEWLEQAGFGQFNGHGQLERFAAEHMAERLWMPSATALLAAERILEPPALAPALQDMFIQARCLDIIVEALGVIAGRPAAPVLRPRERQCLQRLLELLDSGDADDWPLQRIAHHVGSNPTSLQRLFRAHSGLSIFGYQRDRRLQQAHAALSRDALSVEQAAAIAGYTSAANFATAFKRRYGITPRRARGPK